MPEGTVTTKGLRELIRAADAAGKETKKAVRDRLRQVATVVKAEAASRFAPTDAHAAGGFGVSVRRTGLVTVEQRQRRTTGQHPNFGGLQMRRALLPALDAKSSEVERSMEQAVDDIADIFER